MRKLALVAAVAASLLCGCGANRGEPAAPGDIVSWNRMGVDKSVRSLRLEYPTNWPLKVRRRHGQSITINPTDCEFWRLEYRPDAVSTDLGTFADAVSAERRARRELLNSNRMNLELHEREAIKVDYEALDGCARGVRYVLAGGFIVEYEYRPQYEKTVAPAFRQLTMSLEITDNR